MDPLSVALRSIPMSGSLIARAELTAPWGLGLEPFGAAVFHVVLSGSGWLRTEEGRTTRLSAGDVAVLMRGQRHELMSEPDVPITSFADLMQHCVPGRFPSIGIAGGGDHATMLCGFFKFERHTSHPLLRALPDLIHINAGSGPGMIEGLVAMADAESAMPLPGSGALTDLLCGLLLVQILRAQLAVDSRAAAPWIHGLDDARVGAALELILESPQTDWTVARLASAVAMSRSNFAQRFAGCVGESPMRYLARCRILRAAQLLDAERLSVSAAMQSVGYESESSFTKAFQRHLGCTPAAYRGSQRRSRPREVLTAEAVAV
ncbi:MAG: AraC family transcriptional regulator [Chloroflexi bacterium]|nr:MAG: AraC family transcriptional regulator [Chloroflexota bacterium]